MTVERQAADVFQDLYPRLVGALGLFCGDRSMAEDLAQDALSRLWERWPTSRRPAHPMAWCYRVGVNLARSAARRRAIEKRALRPLALAPDIADGTGAVADALTVRAALLELPARQRQAVVARYYLGLSVEEAALAMGCASGTVTALTHQAIVNLRRPDLLGIPGSHEEVRA